MAWIPGAPHGPLVPPVRPSRCAALYRLYRPACFAWLQLHSVPRRCCSAAQLRILLRPRFGALLYDSGGGQAPTLCACAAAKRQRHRALREAAARRCADKMPLTLTLLHCAALQARAAGDVRPPGVWRVANAQVGCMHVLPCCAPGALGSGPAGGRTLPAALQQKKCISCKLSHKLVQVLANRLSLHLAA